MDRLIKRIVVIASVAACFAGERSVASNPVGDFFKRLGNSIAHPHRAPSPPPRRNLRASVTSKKQDGNEQTPPQNAPPPAPTATLTPEMVRAASTVPPLKSRRRDMPYGIPVPNKPGFVTSPYQPKSGYVDVRGFPSGTEVKDPYSGKIFLNP